MKLMRLKLENFQGIKDLKLDLNGANASIYGDNATGKTTVFNAYTWVLFGRSSTNSKGFTPKTRTSEGEAHNMNHSVEAEIMDGTGQIVRLKKTYHEVYKRQRGSASEEFAGHTTDFEIDGVPVKEKDYMATVEGLCGGDAEKAKLLSMPDYFAEWIGWEERRKVLLSICGDVSDVAVIDSDPELADLPTILLKPGVSGSRYKIDEYKAIAEAAKKDINRQLTEIPSRIDEQMRIACLSVEETEDELKAKVAELEQRRRSAEEERSVIQSGRTGDSEIRAEIARLCADLVEKKAAYVKDIREKEADETERRSKIEGMIRTVSAEIFDLETQIHRKGMQKEDMEARRASIIEEIRKVRSEEWDDAELICPTCGQRIPEDQATAKKEAFLQHKARRLEKLNERGRETAGREKIADLEVEISSILTQLEQKKAEKRAHESMLETVKTEYVVMPLFEETPEGKDAQAKIEEAKARLEAGKTEVSGAVEDLNRKIEEIGQEIFLVNCKLSAIDIDRRKKERIAELEAKEKALAAEYEKFERGLWLCGRFLKRKVQMLDDKINGRFSSVRFRLFKEQINGGVAEDCEVLVPSPDGNLVPYPVANNAGRINAGMEIIETLAAFYGVQMPVFVDNAESVTRLRPSSGQVIRLVVSENDKTLRCVNE